MTTQAELAAVHGVLDALPLAFLVVGADGEIRHLSQGARELLGRHLTGDELAAMLGPLYAPLVTSVLAGNPAGMRWREHALPVAGDQLVEVALRTLPLVCEDGPGMLLIIHDVSAEIGLHRRYRTLLGQMEAVNDDLRRRIGEVLREHEDDLALFGELLQVAPAIFAGFVAEAEACVRAARQLLTLTDEVADEPTALALAMRESHTLKGNARGLGLNAIAGRAHTLEELIVRAERGQPPTPGELASAIGDVERAIASAVSLRGSLASAGTGGSELSGQARALDGAADRLATALRALAADHPARTQVAAALAVVDDAARVSLAQLADYLRALARTVALAAGREVPELVVPGEDVRVPARLHAVLQTALPHLVRNAVVHGLESAGERLAAGKPQVGTLTLTARLTDDALLVTLADDGRGLNEVALRAAAAARGLDIEDLAELVFTAGLSSRDMVDLDAGRGVGTTAAKEAVVALGGSIAVTSRPGAGTTFSLRMPLSRP